MEITREFLEKSRKDFVRDRANAIAQRAAVNAGLLSASFERKEDRSNGPRFNIELKDKVVRNQKKSGRCWMFAALNVMEYKLCQKYHLKEFELSKNYTLFYDKLERCNYFLDAIRKTAEQDLDSRLVHHLLSDPMGDGGQWDMLKHIIKKYGLVPLYAMPESENSSDTSGLNKYLTKLLRLYAKNLRQACAEKKDEAFLSALQEEYMQNVYRILCISLGTPPETFDFEARTKEDESKFISFPDLTPIAFYREHIPMDVDDYVSLINAPTEDKPYYRSYTVDFLGNVLEMGGVRYVNVPIEVMKQAIVAQLKDDDPVWFGCDVGQYFARSGANLDLTSLSIYDLWNVKMTFSKAEELDYKESLMTHAMVFVGCDYDEAKHTVNRYKVENSWGKDAGRDGYLVMSDAWFDHYMYQALIHKKHLSPEVLKAYEEEPICLKPWDPMGSLA